MASLTRNAIPLNIGLFGFGTVGGGVYDILQKREKQWMEMGINAKITKICVRDLSKDRGITLSPHTTLVTNYDDILNDSSINCVLELMGGTDHAKHVTFKAIEAGKHVVSANKALIAEYMDELLELLKANPSVRLGYEAAVCGGIPIIHTLQDSYLGDKVSEIAGIMNGTTNFMLSKMEKCSVSYSDVLKEAQDLGFAEANPSADVDGFDVQSKIAILAKLAFGMTVEPSQVPTTGITSVSQADFEYAKMMKSTIKLLGVAKRLSEEVISVFVSPVIVPEANVIASVNGATNLVSIQSQSLISSAYVGEGAGRYPTANSVVSDILQLARGLTPSTPFPNSSIKDTSLRLETNYQSRFYVRIQISDQVGIVRVIGGLAEKYNVSIYAILQSPIVDPKKVDFVVTTDVTSLSNVQEMCAAIAKENFVLQDPFYMPILED